MFDYTKILYTSLFCSFILYLMKLNLVVVIFYFVLTTVLLILSLYMHYYEAKNKEMFLSFCADKNLINHFQSQINKLEKKSSFLSNELIINNNIEILNKNIHNPKMDFTNIKSLEEDCINFEIFQALFKNNEFINNFKNTYPKKYNKLYTKLKIQKNLKCFQ